MKYFYNSTSPLALLLLLTTNAVLSVSSSSSTSMEAATVEEEKQIPSSFSTMTSCRDDETFRYQNKYQQSCEWVDRQDNGCDHLWQGHVVGTTYCPVTCQKCPRQDEIINPSISTDALCYMADGETHPQTIVVQFENARPEPEDWFGIYPIDVLDAAAAAAGPGELMKVDDDHHTLKAWAWLSGNRHKKRYTRALYGSIAVQAILKPGTYKAVLVRRGDHDGPYTVFAESEPFETRFEACPARKMRNLRAGSHQNHHDRDDHYENYHQHQQEEKAEVQERQQQDDENCSINLAVDQTEYTVGGDDNNNIIVNLSSSSSPLCVEHLASSPDAFVGIYDADLATDEIRGDANYEAFLWTCGTQGCHNSNVVNEFVFGSESLIDNNNKSWPLSEGRYRAHLVVPHYDTGRFQSIAQSDVFEVVEEQSTPLSA